MKISSVILNFFKSKKNGTCVDLMPLGGGRKAMIASGVRKNGKWKIYQREESGRVVFSCPLIEERMGVSDD